jgi:uncharacterized protein
MKRVFLIHGWEGNPYDAWKTWLKKKLEVNGFKVIAPQMPGGTNPVLKEWLDIISNIVGKPSKEDYFVGHSLGCISIARYLEKLPKDSKVGGCVFVSGFSGNINIPEISEFYSLPIDFKKVKDHCSNFVVINSDNDPYVPIELGKKFQKQLDAKLILEHKGHISEDEGIKELPSALNAILEFR